MKACPSCGRLYPDDAGFCPVEGSQLTSATKVPVVPDEHDARIGQVFCGRYQLRRAVADGGMGRVYEALDMVERRNVALKILHPEVASNEIAVARFKREFDVSRLLPHGHIVEVIDFQPTHDGTFALVMEFLYGEELRSTLKRESVISPARTVRMLSQVAIGLDEAHERRFVHRDLKPDNLFLVQTREGDMVKILDFGSVKDKGEGAKKLTVLGTTIGSPYYMAPEQAQGLDTLDHRADVWALAAIVYECVTGRVPFRGNNGPSILLEILTKEPVPSSRAAKAQKYPVPPSLDRVLGHAFKKNAALRTSTVGALADAVGAAYGLSGRHVEWATTPEGELTRTIEAKLPELMAAPPPPEEFDAELYSEGENLQSIDQLLPSEPSEPSEAPAPAPSANVPSANVPSAAVVQGVSWGVVAAVGGGALVIGVLIVLALVLAR